MPADQVEEMSRELGSICTDGHLRLSVAESMTGGLLSDSICRVSGASRYFLGGMVCYDPATKAFVGVSQDLMDRFGTYSKEVAAGLAMGANSRFGSDIGVGITGIAEPDAQNKVPGAWVAVAYLGRIETRHVLCEEGTARNEARSQVATDALEFVLEVLKERSLDGE